MALAPKPQRPKQRMAVDAVSHMLLPWKEQPASAATVGQAGKTQAGWSRLNEQVARELEQLSDEKNMISYLINEVGYHPSEAIKTAEDAVRDILKGGSIQSIRAAKYGVPHAAADEMLNRAALLTSGFTKVRPNTVFQGTDILATTPSGRAVGIDAQMRTGSTADWSIPILGNAPNGISRFNNPQNRTMEFGDLIGDLVDNNQRSWADKLLHDGVLHREFFGTELNPGKQKDALISTRRSRKSFDEKRDNAFGMKNARGNIVRQHGPYDVKGGDTLNMVDMESVRNFLLNSRIAELKSKGVEAVPGMNRGGFRLSVPKSIMQALPNNVGTLDPEIVKALSI